MDSQVVDVLIAGAGLSGIGMAVHLKRQCPKLSFTMLEQREKIGGTWSLFNYPGVRSDSDMFTLGFDFEPWTDKKAIADGPDILSYISRIVKKYDLMPNMQLGMQIVQASWNSQDALWTLTLRDIKGATGTQQGRFLYMGTGYYDYEQGHQAVFEGRDTFKGEIVHPQFWPDTLNYQDKKVVVIGSGATAVTLLPALAKNASHVTMLQRTPTYYAVRPSEDKLANALAAVLPNKWAYRINRWRNIKMQNIAYKLARSHPNFVSNQLIKHVRKALEQEPNAEDFTPPYSPWEQRLCLVPDGDMFEAMKSGKASIETGHIKCFNESGIILASGKQIDADLIVTATGLKLAMAGKVEFWVDGEQINFADHFYYKGCMFSNVPNMAIVFGYLNASWTLKADIVSHYVCRILQHMHENKIDIVKPRLDKPDELAQENLFDFSSGYIQRDKSILPKQAVSMPWRMNQDYLSDKKVLLNEPVEDGVLEFSNR